MKIILTFIVLFATYGEQLAMRAPSKPIFPSKAVRAAERVIVNRAKLAHAQYQLLRTLRKIPSHKFKPDQLNTITKALSQQHLVHRMRTHESVIDRATAQFITTPGFLVSLQRLFATAITDANSFKGSLYELQQALAIVESKSDETVLGLNQQVSCPQGKLKKEFDICTNLRLIECKNINWPPKPAYAYPLRTQFEQQNKITQLLKAQNGTELYFHICSKERIPHSWQALFDDLEIRYSW